MNLDELWEIIKEKLVQNKELYAEINAVYEFNITDKDALYQIVFHNGEATVFEAKEQDADCSLAMKEADFKKLLLGKLNSTMAFMTGKLKVKGNIQQALALEKMLKQFDLN